MTRKRTTNEWTTVRVSWETKNALVKLGIGRETDNDILKRLIKDHGKEMEEYVKSPEYREYVDKLNGVKKTRKR